MADIKIGIVGLDTMHPMEFTKRLQAPDCPAEFKVPGMRMVNCMAFPSPFQNAEGIKKRTDQLTAWGVKVSADFNETVKGMDAIFCCLNDPTLHLEYFKKCADVGLPMFFDKPLADTLDNGKKIVEIAKAKKLKMFSCSGYRFAPGLEKALAEIPKPDYGYFAGPLGIPAVGSKYIWYGVHTVEMLVKAMGKGAKSVITNPHSCGATIVVKYEGKKFAVADLTEGIWSLSGILRNSEGKGSPFHMTDGNITYTTILKEFKKMFETGVAPVPLEDTLEVAAISDAADRSSKSGKEEKIAL